MLSLKTNLIVCVVSLIIGTFLGYSIRDEKARINDLENIQNALEVERDNLIKQLEKEHEWQITATETAEKAQADLESLEASYADAINELNDLQLFYSTQDYTDEPALSDGSSSAPADTQSKCKCGGTDEKAFQNLLNEQMMLARDCDINAIYLNQIIDLYNSIR